MGVQRATWGRDEFGQTAFWILDADTVVFRCARWDVVSVASGVRASHWTVTEISDRGLAVVPHDLGGHARTGRGLADLFVPSEGRSVQVRSPGGQEALFDCVGESGDLLFLAPCGVPVERRD